ncbi:hypothetical protein PCH_Pc16g14420 [Penicillium rubens Wisconsin 54-1255]|uniref:Uncharacterized protein n=1 Tax=Penicillium rubens (strain ATCC 28089 / DSM 1075 / NRRL 1951 / Wisconsin 54-1255) TaxID=500485 RepID=B6H9Y8_PENRW|nr:hypothetical protein PCH_Pc16g14420 [Penicillium rubens Wisconsin 54-1255]
MYRCGSGGADISVLCDLIGAYLPRNWTSIKISDSTRHRDVLFKPFFIMSLIDLLSLPRLVNSGSLEGFIKYMGILASSSESQFASVVLGEIRINGKPLEISQAFNLLF